MVSASALGSDDSYRVKPFLLSMTAGSKLKVRGKLFFRDSVRGNCGVKGNSAVRAGWAVRRIQMSASSVRDTAPQLKCKIFANARCVISIRDFAHSIFAKSISSLSYADVTATALASRKHTASSRRR
eukprot:IDg17519t1